MKRKNVEERYWDNVRKQQKKLEDFAEHEIEWANHLITWYRCRKEEMPDDEYRACAFFLNKEHAVSERFFTMRLKEMGFEQCRMAEARFWAGIGLRMSNEKWEQAERVGNKIRLRTKTFLIFHLLPPLRPGRVGKKTLFQNY
jgi:hypothetical protein